MTPSTQSKERSEHYVSCGHNSKMSRAKTLSDSPVNLVVPSVMSHSEHDITLDRVASQSLTMVSDFMQDKTNILHIFWKDSI